MPSAELRTGPSFCHWAKVVRGSLHRLLIYQRHFV
jgi:hypothetical protein